VLEKLLEGLTWGVLAVGALIPIALFVGAFVLAWSWLGPKLAKPEDSILEGLFEDPPPLPLPDEHEPPERYKYVPSTILRPPSIVQQNPKDPKDDEDNGEDDE